MSKELEIRRILNEVREDRPEKIIERMIMNDLSDESLDESLQDNQTISETSDDK